MTMEYNVNDASHPVLAHGGRDFGTPIGTNVHAPEAGQVAFAGRGTTAGNAVVVSGQRNSYMFHLSGFAVKQGQKVSAGDLLGYTGNTGRSTGPHLHFEQRVGGPVWAGKNVEPCRF